jgi:hypothetical protein
MIRAEFIPIASRPLVTFDVDFTDGDDFSMLLERYGDWSHIRDASVRVRYRASEEDHRRVDVPAVKRALLELGAHRVVSVEPTILRENRARAAVDESMEPAQALAAWCEANGVDTENERALAELLARWSC